MERLVQAITNCTVCDLYRTRTHVVPGKGPTNASIMIVGEAPGAEEDACGEPFVGAAGKMLTRLLKEAGINRDDVFITNILKCRPPGNADPTPDQIAACINYLKAQIKIVQPKVIVTLGRYSSSRLSLVYGTMGSLLQYDDLSYEGIPIIPLYHPSYLLRLGHGKSPKGKEVARDCVARLTKVASFG